MAYQMNVPSNTYDAVIVGGGHNGLVAACYLARAGFNVCVLERYNDVGGAAFSEEIHARLHRSPTGSYVLSLAPQKILQDLDLFNNGIELIKRNPRFFMPFPDGQSLDRWEDMRQLLAEIAKFSKKDAANYAYYDDFVERACEVMDKFILRNPPTFAEFAAEFNSPDDARIFQNMILGSAAEVAEYFFESEQSRPTRLAFGLIGTFRGPRDAGTAYVKLYHAMGNVTGQRGQWAYVRGAMGARHPGAASGSRSRSASTIRDRRRGRAHLRRRWPRHRRRHDGRRGVPRPIVLSNADPKRTYLKLVEQRQLPDDFVRDIEAIQITSPVMKINLALERTAASTRGRATRD